ncbi:DUF397 domain-containing protein [Streptomyces dioscori]|uniref:DUF397 domain-containing protein n=1 Tax=Streptomyces dioscori TaxID=2109333 RepID=A0A2P8QCY0_9ACTN|nr:DUF397 domain-containing protein [Streptomyces dioscori]PSM44068.1 DUF397 domain-containing protein [Streptomyces dioscori]
MLIPNIWTKSSFSGGGQGDACVEVAHRRTHIAVRDSKTPAGVALAFPAGAFVTFVESLKNPGPPEHRMEP